MTKITVHSIKYDQSLHNHLEAHLLDEGEWGWLTYLGVNEKVESYRGSYVTRHNNLRWHWRDQWWDAILVFDDQGRWLEWYCNIVTPPTMTDGVLTFTDLDLDVVWHRDRGLHIADADEFELHAVQMAYPNDLIQRAWDTAHHVRQMIVNHDWRFAEDPTTLRFEKEIALWRDDLT